VATFAASRSLSFLSAARSPLPPSLYISPVLALSRIINDPESDLLTVVSSRGNLSPSRSRLVTFARAAFPLQAAGAFFPSGSSLSGMREYGGGEQAAARSRVTRPIDGIARLTST